MAGTALGRVRHLAFLKDVRTSFEKVVIRKPKTSRSREVYLVAKGSTAAGAGAPRSKPDFRSPLRAPYAEQAPRHIE